MYKKYINIGILVSIVILIGIGCTSAIKEQDNQQKNVSDKPDMSVTFNPLNERYQVGQPFNLSARIDTTGGPALTIMSCKKEGYENACVSANYGEGRTTNVFTGCDIPLQDGIGSKNLHCQDNSFSSSGTYIFEIKMYTCESLKAAGLQCCVPRDNNEKSPCFPSNPELTLKSNVQPFKTIEKIIEVQAK